MLYLLLQIRDDWYALDVAQVVEVLPLVRFKQMMHAPAGLAGVFNYHGNPVPLIDLSELIAATPTQTKMSTRVILISHPSDSGRKLLIGLLVEQLMETIRRTDTEFIHSDAAVTASPWLGAIAMDGERIIHRIEVGGLLSGSLRDHLLPPRPVSA